MGKGITESIKSLSHCFRCAKLSLCNGGEIPLPPINTTVVLHLYGIYGAGEGEFLPVRQKGGAQRYKITRTFVTVRTL
jgi:hypothetical protein